MVKKNIHEGHRQRLLQQIQKSGLDNMTDVQVLEYILTFFIPRKDTNVTAHLLLDEFGSIQKVLDASPEMLLKIEGVGERTAKMISLLPAIFQRYKESGLKQKKIPLKNFKAVVNFLFKLFESLTVESFYILYFDAKQNLLDFEKIGDGDQNKILLNIQQIINSILKQKASMVVFAHNHPGGEAYPSIDDIKTTTKLLKALFYNDIKIMDHIIIAGNQYYSFNQNNVIKDYYDNTLNLADQKLSSAIYEKIQQFGKITDD